MLLSLFLLLLAQDVAQPTPNGDAVDLRAAIQLAQEGSNAEALVALQKIAAANPTDHLTRLWIANVYARMGHPDIAEPIYRSITLEDPRNVDAWVGLGTVLLRQDRISEGLNALRQAEDIAPENPEVWAALASGYQLAGERTESITYYQRLVGASPTPSNRVNLENARLADRHRFESQTFGEQFNRNMPATRGSDLGINIRLAETTRVIGLWQVQKKFNRTENRGGGGFEWRWTPWGTVSGQVLIGNDDRILPQRDYLARVDYAYHNATYTGAVRYFDFFGANVTMISPAVTVAVTPRWTFAGRYAYTSTDTATVTATGNNTVDLLAAYEVAPRVWLRGGYINGIENFNQFTIDEIGQFRANTASAAVQFLFPSLTSIVARYDYQWRKNGVRMGRVDVALVQAF